MKYGVCHGMSTDKNVTRPVAWNFFVADPKFQRRGIA
jgi:hypothetical protein